MRRVPTYLDLLLEYKINRNIYPLAEYIYKYVKDNYISKWLTSNGRPALSFTDLKYLSGFGIDKPLYVYVVCDMNRSNNWAEIFEENRYVAIYINEAPLTNFDSQKYGDKVYLHKIVHELSHLFDDKVDMIDKTSRNNTASEKDVGRIYYMFNSRELEARVNEAYSYYYHNPKIVVGFIKKHAKDGQMSLKAIVSDMIKQTNFYSFVDYMDDHIEAVAECRYEKDSIVMIMAKDKQNGEFNLFSGMPSARQIKDESSFFEARKIVYSKLKKIEKEFYDYLFQEIAELIKWYVKTYYTNNNKQGTGQTAQT